jgi:hypothetical protein
VHWFIDEVEYWTGRGHGAEIMKEQGGGEGRVGVGGGGAGEGEVGGR